MGAFHPRPEHIAPQGTGTLVMLGPKEPGFWGHFTASPEYQDGVRDPLDRWSERVVTGLAKALNAKPYFPFGGPPFQPFIRWAHATGRAHQSPVGLLVHDTAGLMGSYRGALAFEAVLELPENPPSPCLTCDDKPCITACPVDAFGQGFYDVPTCKADLDRAENDCISKGCAVRRVCPVSQTYGREEAQSSFHMEAFK
ncbi:ferredoxin [Roseovarius sp. 2305UL8-3]|uniref:ferredoxin n=1 Tax=Roseovarius conchicola TaxID=3121636 RepID=UPI0035299E8C